jgi:hypothetical protein
MTPRLLDYVPRLDERNRTHRVTADTSLTGRSIFWAPGVVLDQGQEGSCVGHGVVGEYLASPARGKLTSYNRGVVKKADIGHLLAVSVYNRAKEVDEFEGVNYDGTSVRAGMLVGRERGWYDGFKWALNMAELRAALQLGPVVIGIEWRDDMYDTDAEGLVRAKGKAVGGHCLVITGYSPNWENQGPVYRWRNSWGPSYGRNGSGYITPGQLDGVLFQTGGEAAVPVGRHV